MDNWRQSSSSAPGRVPLGPPSGLPPLPRRMVHCAGGFPKLMFTEDYWDTTCKPTTISMSPLNRNPQIQPRPLTAKEYIKRKASKAAGGIRTFFRKIREPFRRNPQPGQKPKKQTRF